MSETPGVIRARKQKIMERNERGCILPIVAFVIVVAVIALATKGWTGIEAALGVLAGLVVLLMLWFIARTVF